MEERDKVNRQDRREDEERIQYFFCRGKRDEGRKGGIKRMGRKDEREETEDYGDLFFQGSAR